MKIIKIITLTFLMTISNNLYAQENIIEKASQNHKDLFNKTISGEHKLFTINNILNNIKITYDNICINNNCLSSISELLSTEIVEKNMIIFLIKLENDSFLFIYLVNEKLFMLEVVSFNTDATISYIKI